MRRTPREDRLRAVLEGVNCAEMAKEMRVSRQAVWRWSHGVWPPLHTFVNLCGKVGKRVEWFYDEEEEHGNREQEAEGSQG